MLSKFKLNQLYFKDTQFANLMTRRIFNVLLIANPYDAFMLEDDGRIDEKIFNEYTSLSLRYPPRFTQVSTCEEALAQLSSMPYDLIICMPGTGDNEGFDVARTIKGQYEAPPCASSSPAGPPRRDEYRCRGYPWRPQSSHTAWAAAGCPPARRGAPRQAAGRIPPRG